LYNYNKRRLLLKIH